MQIELERVYKLKNGSIYGVSDGYCWYWSTYHQKWMCSDVSPQGLQRASVKLVAKNVVIKCTNPS